MVMVMSDDDDEAAANQIHHTCTCRREQRHHAARELTSDSCSSDLHFDEHSVLFEFDNIYAGKSRTFVK